MDEKIKLLAHGLGEHRVKENEELIYSTASKLEAVANFYYIATTRRELIESLNACLDLRIPIRVLGSGTKTLSKDVKKNVLIIKNRTSNIKVNALKGKVGRVGIGVESAMVEVESGVTLIKFNEFLEKQNLQKITDMMFPAATIGGSLFAEQSLREIVKQITIWDEGQVQVISLNDLQSSQIILAAVVEARAA